MKKLLLMLWGVAGFVLSTSAQNSSLIKFTENNGQWDSFIKYKADVPSGSLFLQQKQLTWLFWDPTYFARVHDHHHGKPGLVAEEPKDDATMDMHAFNISFPGASDQCTLEGQGVHSDKSNYFIGSDSSRWASNVSSYEKVLYHGLWPGIDLAVFEFANSMKYEYRLNAGVDVSTIQMKYSGADSISIIDGHLIVKTSVLSYSEDKPIAWQYNGEERIMVRCDFHLEDSTVSFSFPEGYDKSLPLVIDPKLIFSTYSGATSDNWGNSACFDDAGNLYSAGTTFMSGFPATVGAFQTSFQGDEPTTSANNGHSIDCAILKFNTNGTQLLAATYLGGFQSEMPFSLFVNTSGELLVLGATSSSGQIGSSFPITAGAYQTIYGGGTTISPLNFTYGGFTYYGGVYLRFGSDLFVARLSGDLSSLLSSTFVGGSANDGVLLNGDPLTKNYGDQFRGDIIADSLNFVYIASHTQSSNFFGSLSTGYDLTYNGGAHDAVVLKLAPDLSSAVWGTYLGGTGAEAAFSIQVDTAKGVFVTGGTTSANFPVIAGSYDVTYNGGGDGWVTHIRKDGTALLASTFIGTTSYDQAYFIQLDKQLNVFLLGQTRGAYPVKNAAYFNNAGGQFIQELDFNLTTSKMSTVFGSGGYHPNISPTAFLVNDCGNIFINGWGGDENNSDYGYVGGDTKNMPLTLNAFQDFTDGDDFYLIVLERNSQSLLYATYIGDQLSGDHVDGGTSRFDKKGIVYAAVCGGCGGSSGFPTYPKPGAWSNTNNSNYTINGVPQHNCNNAAYKFDLANLIADFDMDTTRFCGHIDAVFTNQSTGGTSFQWLMNGVQFSSSSISASYSFTTSGQYHVQLIATDATTCIGKDTADAIIDIVVPSDAVSAVFPDSTICEGDTIRLQVIPADIYHTYLWSPNTTISDIHVANPEVWPLNDIDYFLTVTDTTNCVSKDTVHIHVSHMDLNTTWAPEANCRGEVKAVLSNPTIGSYWFIWNFGDGSPVYYSPTSTLTHGYPGPGTYESTLIIDNGVCQGYDTVLVNLTAVKIPNLMTMNNDGLNDVFEIEGITKDWKVDVYNRWGQRVFSKENYLNEFDGLEQRDGIYYYLVTSPDGKECKGWVQLMR